MAASKKKALLLRIPPDLWESLNRWAQLELRSVNAQIEYILRAAVRKHAGDEPPDSSSPITERDPNDPDRPTDV